MLIYLASPYYHENPAVRQSRYEQARAATVDLLLRGSKVFSPIVNGHNLLPELSDWGHRQWLNLDLAVLAKCDQLAVLMIDGWKESKGVAEELQYAEERGMPVIYLKGTAYG